MLHVWWYEARTVLWWGNLREKDNLEDQDIGGTTIFKWIFKNRLGEFGFV